MEGGSLADAMVRQNVGRSASPPLMAPHWRLRLKIALDCAAGLHYLHQETSTGEPAMVHRDIKSAVR
jgi:hypothetical protein